MNRRTLVVVAGLALVAVSGCGDAGSSGKGAGGASGGYYAPPSSGYDPEYQRRIAEDLSRTSREAHETIMDGYGNITP